MIVRHVTKIAGILAAVLCCAQVQAECREQLPRRTDADDFVFSLVPDGGGFLGAVIEHKTSGLEWMRCQVGQTLDLIDNECRGVFWEGTWQEGLQKVADINAGIAPESNLNETDWRMPSFKELMTVIDFGCTAPALDPTMFKGSPVGAVWSSTPSLDAPDSALVMRIGLGLSLTVNKTLQDAFLTPGLWLVRDAD